MAVHYHYYGHMQTICTSLQTDNHASTPPLSFYRPDALPAAQPTASKHWRHFGSVPNHNTQYILASIFDFDWSVSVDVRSKQRSRVMKCLTCPSPRDLCLRTISSRSVPLRLLTYLSLSVGVHLHCSECTVWILHRRRRVRGPGNLDLAWSLATDFGFWGMSENWDVRASGRMRWCSGVAGERETEFGCFAGEKGSKAVCKWSARRGDGMRWGGFAV